ncbi:MAG: DUF4145 domain-containing protein [Pseudomonadota bacterium]|nr:DUF4145 domain-containing protein [Pseudomonadota bacterium]
MNLSRISKFTPLVVSALAFVLLILHTFDWGSLRVDTTSILLLVVIVLAPLSELVKKIKVGDFEAEIGSREVEKVSESLKSSEIGELEKPSLIHSDIPKLVESDPQLGMAKLRIELERLLKVIYFRVEQPEFDIDNVPLNRLLNELTEKRVIPVALQSSVRDVISLANRAIHGESIKTQDAENLANLGVKVITELRRIFRGLPGKAVEKRPISIEQQKHYSGAKYKVTAITPYVDEPYLSTYILDKKGMDDLLNGYHEYAQYIVGVEVFDDTHHA